VRYHFHYFFTEKLFILNNSTQTAWIYGITCVDGYIIFFGKSNKIKISQYIIHVNKIDNGQNIRKKFTKKLADRFPIL
jgi:hypothetical protein